MIRVGAWRWPIVVGLTIAVAGGLAWSGRVYPVYEGQAALVYSGNVAQLDQDLKLFRSNPSRSVALETAAGEPSQIRLRTQSPQASGVVQSLMAESQKNITQSVSRRKEELHKTMSAFEVLRADRQTLFNQLLKDRETVVAGPRRGTPRAELAAQIEELKARRQLLIARYPSHSDIALLAGKIQALLKQMETRPEPLAERITDLDRQINEAKLRMEYFARLSQEAARAEKALKPEWKLSAPVQKPQWPKRVEGWPLAAGALISVFALGIFVFRGGQKPSVDSSSNGLWRPEAEAPVELQVVSPESDIEAAPLSAPESGLPSDPMTEKARILYSKWVDVAHVLYQPAAEPPQGVLDQVGPLLQESAEFLPEGHDTMARVLAHSVAPNDLPAHVARTVLMTLTGAQEAGVSPEHRLAMALAALFHDLAMVPRPVGHQDQVGSEVGRLSATALRRIPGLQPALLSMVEDILIGMDEFKLETWQNTATDSTLEPLSKVLREIDRFEKLMQKQRSRLDRRVANQ